MLLTSLGKTHCISFRRSQCKNTSKNYIAPKQLLIHFYKHAKTPRTRMIALQHLTDNQKVCTTNFSLPKLNSCKKLTTWTMTAINLKCVRPKKRPICNKKHWQLTRCNPINRLYLNLNEANYSKTAILKI